MKLLNRRDFLRKSAILTGGEIIAPFFPGWHKEKISFIARAHADIVSEIYVSKNGTPLTNMQKVINMGYGQEGHIQGRT